MNVMILEVAHVADNNKRSGADAYWLVSASRVCDPYWDPDWTRPSEDWLLDVSTERAMPPLYGDRLAIVELPEGTGKNVLATHFLALRPAVPRFLHVQSAKLVQRSGPKR